MFKGMKSLIAAAGIAGVIAGASAAQAANAVQIDLSGAGSSWTTIQSIDLNAGNTLAVGSQNAGIGDSFDVYFQSSISVINVAGGGQLAGVGTTYYLTTVVKFSESITNTVPGSFAIFGEGNGTNEYFELWLSTTPPNDLAGTGFGADNGSGVLLLSGSNVTVVGGGFVITGSGNDLDGTPDGNQYPGVTSVHGSGSTVIETEIDYVNDSYLRGVNANDVISFVLANPASSATPFDAVNPAQQFWDALTSSYVTPDIGAVNGFTGPDFQFQTNGNLTFETTSTPVVPEPATAAMGLFGLAGLAMAARRRR